MSAVIEDRHIPNITKFVFVSVIIHAAVMSTNALVPQLATAPVKKPPIKVKYIQPEKPKAPEK